MREFEKQFEFISDGRPRLGVNIGEQSDGGPVEGVKIVGVTPGSAADDAGLRSGDIITAINGEAISSSRQARLIVAGSAPGDSLEIVLIRDGVRLTTTTTVGERPEVDPE